MTVVSAFVVLLPMHASAQGARGETVIVAPEVVIEHREQRHLEVRRALVSNVELPERPDERRRLSQDERDALNRELREAMRGVYEQRDRRQRRNGSE